MYGHSLFVFVCMCVMFVSVCGNYKHTRYNRSATVLSWICNECICYDIRMYTQFIVRTLSRICFSIVEESCKRGFVGLVVGGDILAQNCKSLIKEVFPKWLSRDTLLSLVTTPNCKSYLLEQAAVTEHDCEQSFLPSREICVEFISLKYIIIIIMQLAF